MRIEDLDPSDAPLLEALAVLSHAAGALHAPQWLPTLEDAREQLRDAIAHGGVTRVAFAGDGAAIGWTSCMHRYGQVWEIHPLLVAPAYHRRGYGAALVRDLGSIARSRGAGVLILGTSDEIGATSLAGRDLFTDPLAALATLRADAGHSLHFWLRMGFTVVGVTPDAEGPGMPTIHLAKAVSSRRTP